MLRKKMKTKHSLHWPNLLTVYISNYHCGCHEGILCVLFEFSLTPIMIAKFNNTIISRGLGMMKVYYTLLTI